MKNQIKRILVALLAICLIVSLVPVSVSANTGELAGKTIILHTNDVHGNIKGYAFLAALKQQALECGADNVILVDAGDYSQGTTYVSTSKGASAVTMMNAAGYDVATLGNHEFDYGYAQLAENLTNADFKVVCTNVLKDGKSIYDPYTIIEKDGVKIAFVGIETPEAQTKTNPALIKGLTFLTGDALYKNIQASVDAAKKAGANVVIALAHLGIDAESEPYRSVDLLEKVTGIDFVIDGHSHSVLSKTQYGEKGVVTELPLQSTGTAFAYVGCIEIDNATGKIVNNYLIPYDADSLDEEVAAKAQEIIDEINALYGSTFAVSLVELSGAKDPGNRTQETNLGDLITDSMRWAILKDPSSVKVSANNVVAITNGGGIRAWIHRGEISMNDIHTVLPFGNTVAVVYVTGAELLEALEASTYSTPGAVGGFPQVSGIDYTIHTNRSYMPNDETYLGSTYYGPSQINRIVINSVNGQPFDLEAKYAVVTNNFCAAGGDTYHAFASATEQFDTGMPLDEILVKYITEVLDGVIGKGAPLEEPTSLSLLADTSADDNALDYSAPQGRIHFCKGVETTVEGAKEATDHEKGYTGDTVCEECGGVITYGEVIPATNPKTGDTTPIVLIGSVAMLSLAAYVMIKRRKNA